MLASRRKSPLMEAPAIRAPAGLDCRTYMSWRHFHGLVSVIMFSPKNGMSVHTALARNKTYGSSARQGHLLQNSLPGPYGLKGLERGSLVGLGLTISSPADCPVATLCRKCPNWNIVAGKSGTWTPRVRKTTAQNPLKRARQLLCSIVLWSR